jgi:hypothetical protein
MVIATIQQATSIPLSRTSSHNKRLLFLLIWMMKYHSDK